MAKTKTINSDSSTHKYFIIDTQNGTLEEHDTLDAAVTSLSENDELKEAVENGYEDQFVLIKGEKLDFDAEFSGLKITVR